MGSLKLPQYESYLGAFDSKLGHLLPSDIRLPAPPSEVTSVSQWLHPSHLTLVKEPIKNARITLHTVSLSGSAAMLDCIFPTGCTERLVVSREDRLTFYEKAAGGLGFHSYMLE